MEKQSGFGLKKIETSGNVIAIEGMDVKKGLALSGGKFELYSDALAAFYTDATERAHKIKTCLEAGDIPLYVTYVHGMKGAAAIIGADRLSESAKALEMAGKRRDLEYLEAHTESFLHALNALLDGIGNWLTAMKPEDYAFSGEEMRRMLTELRSALSAYNAGAIYRITDNLLKLTQDADINTVVRKLSDNILMGEYDEASAMIEVLQQEVR